MSWNSPIYLMSILFSLSFVIVVLSLVRRRRLREQYSLFWIFLGLIIVLVSLRSNWLDTLAGLLGIVYAPSLLFLIAVLFCFAYMLHLTVVISKLSDRVVRLTQELAIYKQREQLAEQAEEVNPHE
jgi:hypothetical protein